MISKRVSAENDVALSRPSTSSVAKAKGAEAKLDKESPRGGGEQKEKEVNTISRRREGRQYCRQYCRIVSADRLRREEKRKSSIRWKPRIRRRQVYEFPDVTACSINIEIRSRSETRFVGRAPIELVSRKPFHRGFQPRDTIRAGRPRDR